MESKLTTPLIEAHHFTSAGLAKINLAHLKRAHPHVYHDTAEAYWREWYLAHLTLVGEAPGLPSREDDDLMDVPYGTLQAGMDRMLVWGRATVEPDGSVVLIEGMRKPS